MKERLCEICKRPIDAERAEALPDTVLCLEHGREIAKFGGEFIRIAEQERTSKPGSMKKNYGGVNVSKKRNMKALNALKDEHARGTEA